MQTSAQNSKYDDDDEEEEQQSSDGRQRVFLKEDSITLDQVLFISFLLSLLAC